LAGGVVGYNSCFDFEKQKLQYFIGNTAVVKCADENDPISPYQRIRGYGGCPILWKKELNNEVTDFSCNNLT
jgi:hypothetical protein